MYIVPSLIKKNKLGVLNMAYIAFFIALLALFTSIFALKVSIGINNDNGKGDEL